MWSFGDERCPPFWAFSGSNYHPEPNREKHTDCVAERVGFEPTLRFPVNTLSKRAPSATRPSLRRRFHDGPSRLWQGLPPQSEAFSKRLMELVNLTRPGRNARLRPPCPSRPMPAFCPRFHAPSFVTECLQPPAWWFGSPPALGRETGGGVLNRSHAGIIKLLVSFRSRSSRIPCRKGGRR